MPHRDGDVPFGHLRNGNLHASKNRASPARSRENAFLPIVFGATIFLSAVLLFSVQPLVGKLLLPLLGGAPSVWNTVMLFFQAMLLCGYAYAHWSFQRLGPRAQPVVHCGLLVIAALLLPFSIQARGGDSEQQWNHPAIWALITLTRSLGVPVFVLASTAPLLQKWFAQFSHSASKDPYFLYAASNMGSFGALFAYPLLLEPTLRLNQQLRFWAAGFWILGGCIAICAIVLFVRRAPECDPVKDAVRPEAERSIPHLRVLKWIGLSFVPSSLMLGVTNYITTDVASIPLLWVLPLALYLFTFIIAFSKHSKRAELVSSRAIPILGIAVVFPILVQATEPVVVLVLLHLAFFFFAALQCHLKLANSRPPAEQLTAFYLYLSVGGVLGGIFNALLAPVLFSSILEYPLMILVATLIGYPERAEPKQKLVIRPVYGGLLIVTLLAGASALVSLAAARSVGAGNLLAGVFLLLCFFLIRRPIRYTLALATLLVFTSLFRQSQSRVMERDRNFFGVLRVTNDADKPLRRLFHGTTIHGVQFTIPERHCEPLSYYHLEGPVAEIARLFQQTDLPRKVGLIGLGAGAMACYSQTNENWTLYEIDPAVVRIAQDTNYFTYLSECAKAPLAVELGDARLRLQRAEDGTFGLLYLDAFSSDVIPMHLLTSEALQLYRRKVAPNGILAFHLSSRHFELEPLVANLGKASNLHCFASVRGELSPKAIAEGGLDANWVILVTDALIPRVLANATWKRVIPDANAPFWTDDFSSLLRVLKFD